MPSKSISISGDAYDALHAHCVARNVTTASLVESLLTDISGKEVSLQRRPRRGSVDMSCAIEVSAETVERLDAALEAAYPKHKRPSRKRFVDGLMADFLVRSSWRMRR